MKSKFVSRLALSILVVLPVVASSSYAAGQEPVQGGNAEYCRSARQTADIVSKMQMSDGGIAFAIPAECARSAAPVKQDQAARETKRVAPEAAGVNLLASVFNARSPG